MKIYSSAGPIAGDKDAAAHIRETFLRPLLAKGQTAELDFEDVELATQSFVHAMIAAVVREDPASLDLIEFRSCNEAVREVIEIVVDYAQYKFEPPPFPS